MLPSDFINFNRMSKITKISLDGLWNYIPDSESRLSIEEVIFKLSSEKKIPMMKIPTNWQLAGLNNFSGTVWFIKTFLLSNIPPAKVKILDNELTILKFFGVDYFADVWLNSKFVGHHEGYFQSFYFDVTNAINLDSKNVLIVKVYSPLEEPGKVWPNKKKLIKGIFNHHDCRPGGWSLEHGQDKNTGGIWNIVEIEFTKKIFVENIKIETKLNQTEKFANIILDIKHFNAFRQNRVEKIFVEVFDPANKTVIKKEFEAKLKANKGEIKLSFKINNPKLWWCWELGEPGLYKLKINSQYFNSQEILFGIREVRLDEKSQFFLNGKRLFLRGTNLILTQFLSELTREKISNLVSLIKEANINIVRVHAHVNRKELYEEFNKQGILVWQDFALQWTYDESEEFKRNAVSQIKDMVSRFYNHPSIAFWCCHNEPGKQIKSLDPFLCKAVLSEDKSRIVRLASNYEEHAYDGWYWGNAEHFAAAPMGPLVTEFGAQALPEFNSLRKFLLPTKSGCPKSEGLLTKDSLRRIPTKGSIDPPDWELWRYHNFQYEQTFNVAQIEMGNNIKIFINNSQQYQADLIKTAIDFYRRKKNNGITGIFQFMFIDCWASITWSVIDYYGKKKLGYKTLKLAYQPVYVSIFSWQNKYFKGSKLNTDFWVINDLHKKFEDCVINFYFNDKKLAQKKNLFLEEDSIIKINNVEMDIHLPVKIKKGIYTINIELLDSNRKLLSLNNFQIEIVDNPSRLCGD